MSETASISSGIAVRYATAVFELAKDGKSFNALDADIAALDGALAASPDLSSLLTSPIYGREDMEAAIVAVSKHLALSPTMTHTLALMAQKRRLFVVPAFLAALKGMLADERGEVTAEVTSAKALTKPQASKLAKVIKAQVGSDVTLTQSVDESLIGGLIVKVGSRMIDTSIKSKLNALQNSMKEVG